MRSIYSIYGGPEVNGASNNARKRYTWEMSGDLCIYNLHEWSPSTSIIFTSNDKMSSPYKDSLVFMLWVGSCDGYRILIYTKSSIDLLFLIDMQELWVKDSNITKKKMPLVEFNSTIYAIRMVVLLVNVTGSIIKMNFVVIDIPAHYNTILGRLGHVK